MATNIDFCGLSFTLEDLQSEIKKIGPKTRDAEKYGQFFLKNLTDAHAYEFSKTVCQWGGGARVWSKLEGNYDSKQKLGKKMRQWLVKVPALSVREAIEEGLNLNGLGVSFASKHLRILYPKRFATLDSVLEGKVGFARNPAGYQFFMHSLELFRKKNNLKSPVADIEQAIYMLAKS